mmetsp:Transcript_2772/g.8157  ORF Transcript_2772/g.8157 Transcript_2772/m.8157 type:complete len:283 (+) Transcript_2772:476-1324(+)
MRRRSCTWLGSSLRRPRALHFLTVEQMLRTLFGPSPTLFLRKVLCSDVKWPARTCTSRMMRQPSAVATMTISTVEATVVTAVVVAAMAGLLRRPSSPMDHTRESTRRITHHATHCSSATLVTGRMKWSCAASLGRSRVSDRLSSTAALVASRASWSMMTLSMPWPCISPSRVQSCSRRTEALCVSSTAAIRSARSVTSTITAGRVAQLGAAGAAGPLRPSLPRQPHRTSLLRMPRRGLTSSSRRLLLPSSIRPHRRHSSSSSRRSSSRAKHSRASLRLSRMP